MSQSVTEHWKPVPDYSNYLVSSLARIFNTKTNKFIKPVRNGIYEKVVLHNGKTSWQTRVHRLVALLHVPNPLDLPLVNHLKPVRLHEPVLNHSYALEWTSYKGNYDYMAVSNFIGFEEPAELIYTDPITGEPEIKEPSAEEQAIDHCPICEYGELVGDNCERCSPHKKSTTRENYYRAAGMFS